LAIELINCLRFTDKIDLNYYFKAIYRNIFFVYIAL